MVTTRPPDCFARFGDWVVSESSARSRFLLNEQLSCLGSYVSSASSSIHVENKHLVMLVFLARSEYLQWSVLLKLRVGFFESINSFLTNWSLSVVYAIVSEGAVCSER